MARPATVLFLFLTHETPRFEPDRGGRGHADNPIITKLAARPNLHDEVSRHALISLYNNALLLLLARSLPAADVQAMFVQYNQVIDLLLALAAKNDG